MNRILFPLAFLSLISRLAFSIQPNTDSLVNPAEIIYSSELEKQVFLTYLHDSSSQNLISVLLLTGSGLNSIDINKDKSDIYYFISNLKKSDVNELTGGKKIKFIYGRVHETFFKQYDLNKLFYSIFSSGNYNCVTATALYAIIFDALEIPFVIREKPTYVFLVAYPDTYNIQIETTTPGSGSVAFNDKAQKEYIIYLRKNKLISEEDARQKSVNELFNQYYFSDNSISPKQLAGLQYFNYGVEKIKNNNFREAFREFEKAYALYPSQRIAYMLFINFAAVLNGTEYNDTSDLQYLVKALRYQRFGITPQNLTNEFYRLTKYQLIDRSNISFYDKAYKYLMNNIANENIRKEFSYIYQFEKGRYYYNKGNISQANELFAEAYALKPNNSEIQTMFMGTLAQSFAGISNTEAVRKFSEYHEKFPRLDSNAMFLMMETNLYLRHFGELYDLKDINGAEKFRLMFENLIDGHHNIMINNWQVGEAYSSAAVYYFKKGGKKKARELILQGLKYAPGNIFLKSKLDALNR